MSKQKLLQAAARALHIIVFDSRGLSAAQKNLIPLREILRSTIGERTPSEILAKALTSLPRRKSFFQGNGKSFVFTATRLDDTHFSVTVRNDRAALSFAAETRMFHAHPDMDIDTVKAKAFLGTPDDIGALFTTVANSINGSKERLAKKFAPASQKTARRNSVFLGAAGHADSPERKYLEARRTTEMVLTARPLSKKFG